MQNNEEGTPSPYVHTLHEPNSEDKEFIEQINEVCVRHGYNHFFIAFTPSINDRNWKGFSGGLSEGLVVYLEIMSTAMRKTWEHLKGLGPKK